MVTHIRERGAALFIVVLVLALLAAIGVFAAKASAVGEQTAGYERQNMQNHYSAEYGMLSVTTDLAVNAAKYNGDMTNKNDAGDRCAINRNVDGGAPTCRQFSLGQGLINAAGRPLFDEGGTTAPGSYGAANVQGNFNVELTDVSNAPRPPPGWDVGSSDNKFVYKQVNLTGSGAVRPATATGVCDETSAVVEGTESIRGSVTFGPIPNK